MPPVDHEWWWPCHRHRPGPRGTERRPQAGGFSHLLACFLTRFNHHHVPACGGRVCVDVRVVLPPDPVLSLSPLLAEASVCPARSLGQGLCHVAGGPSPPDQEVRRLTDLIMASGIDVRA